MGWASSERAQEVVLSVGSADGLFCPQLFGDVCYNCSHVIEGDVVSALCKAWCVNCFSCSTCNMKLTLK